MNRALQLINAFGVLALAVLCVFQWKAHRALNLEAIALEKTAASQSSQIEKQEQTIRETQADLDAFRSQLQRHGKLLADAQDEIRASRASLAQMTAERDRLLESLEQWKEALAARDKELERAGEQLETLAEDRNEAVLKFNDLAQRHNELVETLNTRTKEYNDLVEKFNAMTASARP